MFDWAEAIAFCVGGCVWLHRNFVGLERGRGGFDLRWRAASDFASANLEHFGTFWNTGWVRFAPARFGARVGGPEEG